jgi:hypothetical protein
VTDKTMELERPPVSDVKAFREHVENHARKLRRLAGIDPDVPFDPRSLTREFGIHLVGLDEINNLNDADREHLAAVDARVWSGVGVPLPDGQTLVLLHPGQTRERATVTIMEEVCHAYYGHQPTRLLKMPGGIVRRDYDREKEAEAYWTAAAALLPAHVVAKAVWRGTEDRLAPDYGVSSELVIFRIKILRLWGARRMISTN